MTFDLFQKYKSVRFYFLIYFSFIFLYLLFYYFILLSDFTIKYKYKKGL